MERPSPCLSAKRASTFLLALGVLGCGLETALADTVIMQNGDRLTGNMVWQQGGG